MRAQNLSSSARSGWARTRGRRSRSASPTYPAVKSSRAISSDSSMPDTISLYVRAQTSKSLDLGLTEIHLGVLGESQIAILKLRDDLRAKVLRNAVGHKAHWDVRPGRHVRPLRNERGVLEPVAVARHEVPVLMNAVPE